MSKYNIIEATKPRLVKTYIRKNAVSTDWIINLSDRFMYDVSSECKSIDSHILKVKCAILLRHKSPKLSHKIAMKYAKIALNNLIKNGNLVESGCIFVESSYFRKDRFLNLGKILA